MEIQIDDRIEEGTEFAIYINDELINIGFCEHERQVDDLIDQIAISLHSRSKREAITISAKALS